MNIERRIASLSLSLSLSPLLTSCFANYEFHFLSCLSHPPPSRFVSFRRRVAHGTAIIAILAKKKGKRESDTSSSDE